MIEAEERLGIEFRREKFRHGLLCAECDHRFTDGERYSQQLRCVIRATDMQTAVPVVQIVCVPCALLGDVAVPKD